MMRNKQIRESAALVLSVWAQLAPNEKFGGYTLEEYRVLVAKSDGQRQRLVELQALRVGALRLRNEADRALNVARLEVVDGVRGHEMFGANSPLYKAMGYVLRDERRSGLTRRPPTGLPPGILPVVPPPGVLIPPDSASPTTTGTP